MDYKCDIILLSYENPDLLKKCVESVLEHTRVPSRLIIVDNAGRDPEVIRYIEGIRGNDRVAVEKIFNPQNLGFSAGINTGMRISIAPFLCLLNNDCIVADGWLEEMISVAEAREDIGLVNPQSNTFGSRPGKGGSLSGHAALLKEKKGKFVELGHAIGFACLIKREVVKLIGYLDEKFQGVCYEDTDYSLRAQKAGYISVLAEGAYVFHSEQGSRKKLKGKKEIYQKNRDLLEGRWGNLFRVLYLESVQDKGEKIVERYNALKFLARQRSIVDMWIDAGRADTKAHLYDKTVKHADIGVRSVNPKCIIPMTLWKVLTKKKKYDAVILDKGILANYLRFLGPLHRCKVFIIEKDTGEIRSGKGDIVSIKEVGEYLRDG